MRSFKPDGTGYRSDAPFDDETTNKMDYKKWQLQPQFAKKDNEWRPPLGEMDMSTNYSNEFTQKPTQRALPIRPADRKKIDAKFEVCCCLITVCTLDYQSSFQISFDIKQETRAVHFDYSVF